MKQSFGSFYLFIIFVDNAVSETYLEPCETSTMKISSQKVPLKILEKDPKYVPVATSTLTI